jgi:hypothetical protein
MALALVQAKRNGRQLYVHHSLINLHATAHKVSTVNAARTSDKVVLDAIQT